MYTCRPTLYVYVCTHVLYLYTTVCYAIELFPTLKMLNVKFIILKKILGQQSVILYEAVQFNFEW